MISRYGRFRARPASAGTLDAIVGRKQLVMARSIRIGLSKEPGSPRWATSRRLRRPGSGLGHGARLTALQRVEQPLDVCVGPPGAVAPGRHVSMKPGEIGLRVNVEPRRQDADGQIARMRPLERLGEHDVRAPWNALEQVRPGRAQADEVIAAVVTRTEHDVVLPFGKDLRDRKSTRLNSSHSSISYAVFCLK